MKTILVVEDNAGIREMVREYLAEHGYRVRVASNGVEGLLETRHHPPDLILLDVMMPGMDGLEFLRKYRADAGTPVMFLTARDAELDKVLGLELGADDYLTKPFSMAELLARIRALLRRAGEKPTGGPVRVGVLELDAASRTFVVRGQRVDLTRSEFELMDLFMRHPQRVFTRVELLEHLQEDSVGSERTMDVHVRNIRAKIEEEPGKPRLIETVFGVGYRLNPGGAP
ncbi:response regulator transcription factor [Deinococcus maricopensis]|uniref:Two component transcriptional regulator, winged helix family n=1 Tax=Deinococcus maricopensis (strain DSM 21211 / LMG 22137 / NRRL B-23946 / LB-34) TaxID=709986 RepID=E8U458_DEIML|nr:response regulator transcription factor [Deinococcus maricopensis]ADV65895.1 two component transcriptional regulator, winged helix family [Deinococcus maricopensis DSM 21211]